MLRLLFFVFLLFAAPAFSQQFNVFAGIDRPVGEMPPQGRTFDFVWRWQNSPPPYNGLPWNFSIASKFHGFLYYEVDPESGIGFSQIDFRNDERVNGYTACANVVYWGEDRYLMTRHTGGVNPRSSNSLRVALREDPSFWAGVKYVTVGFGWCPSGGVLAEIVDFFVSAGDAIEEAVPTSGRTRIWEGGDSVAPPAEQNELVQAQSGAYQIWVKQICLWPSESGNNNATGSVDYLGTSDISCDAALQNAYGAATAGGCAAMGGNHWQPTTQELIGTAACPVN